jgi:ABC-2 type transport system ATP-binding protein
MHAIQSESLSKVYRSGASRLIALDGFSLDVHQGEVFGLLGPNGAGKTTFIKILLSLTRQTHGNASILGTRLPDDRVKERVGYLPENHRYPGYLTGEQILSLFGALSGVTGARLRERIPSLLALVGMAEWRTMKVKKYSKGMMQRLGLAQALINDPDIVFLDEPTDGVDPLGRKEIRGILLGLKNQGKTIFLNSHLLSEVELISNRVAILDRGKLLKVGTVDDLTSTGSEYRIGIASPLPEGATLEIAARSFHLTAGAEFVTARIESIAELNDLVDLLRKHRVEITSVVKIKSSLEDSFINLIKREVAS